MNKADYIVIGAGSAGCVLTRRLIDAGYSVILLEAGKKDRSPLIHIPLAMAAILPSTHANWAFETEPQAGLNGRRGYQPRGKTFGGSSSINAMLYVRGQKEDYDEWAALGNKGWAYNDVLPYFKKAENNEIFSDEYHGQGGPLNVADQRTPNPFNENFLKDAALLQHPSNPDFNGVTQEGMGAFQVTQINGQRCSAAKGYLTPILGHPNLQVITNAHTSKLLFDGTKCTGVEFIQKGTVKTCTASREVLLSAGAFGSPQILQLSGIGNAEKLKEHGIEVRSNLKGVGENLQDHIDFISSYKAKSLDLLGFSLPGILKLTGQLFKYGVSRRGTFASTVAEVGGFLKSSPDIKRPDIQLHFIGGIVEDHNRTLHTAHGFSCHMCILRPESRGTVRLHNSDPLSAPKIDPRFLSEEADLNAMVRGFKIMREIMTGPNLSQYAVEDLFTAGAETDTEISDLIRNRSDTVYHPVGTAKMGTDNMAVVAPDSLKVHGFSGLRVVDASVMPTIISGNTNAPTIMIAEKAADFILRG